VKIAQTLFILITLNILMIIVNFSIEHQNINTAITDLDTMTSDTVTAFNTFIETSSDKDNWILKFLSDVAAAFQNSINIVFMGVKILFFIIDNIISYPVTIWSTGYHPILRVLGMSGWLFLTWFNIKAIIQIWTVIKGTSQ
jgi:hypothetical protein